MKNPVLILLCTLMICFSVNAQKGVESKVPAVLKAALTKQFPKASDVKWEKEGDNWEVALKNNGKEMTIVMDAKGKITETEVPIQTTELPGAAMKYIGEKFRGKPIISADKITAGTKVTYEVVVEKGKALVFDEFGKFLSSGKD